MDHSQSRVIFITGASSGLGYALAKRYVQDGHKVAITARRFERIQRLAEELNTHRCQVLPIQCDVQQESTVIEAVRQCQSQLGPIDLMIANAGVGYSTPGYKPSTKLFESTIHTNVLGALYCFNAVIPDMIQRKSGQLVSISSLASYRGLPEAGAYSASKAALSAFTESFRLDLKPHGISVTLINPGYIESPMTDRNDYYMPFLMTTEKGVQKIYRAIEKKKRIVAFPFPLSWFVRSFQFWPTWLYDFCFSGRKNKKRPHTWLPILIIFLSLFFI